MKLGEFLSEFPDLEDSLDKTAIEFEVIIQKDTNLDSDNQFKVTKIETDWQEKKIIIHCEDLN